MKQQLQFRLISESDLPAVAEIISRCLREVNAAFYSEPQISKLQEKFTVEELRQRYAKMSAVVAVLSDKIVETGALESNCIKTVFVSPDYLRQGIGWQIMEKLEAMARGAGIGKLIIHASLNAREFYERQGYRYVQDLSWEGGSAFFEMEKSLN